MAWTYDPSRLATVPLFRVRLELGDTDPSDRLFQDEELRDCLARAGASELGAAALAAEHAAARYARQATTSAGQVSVQYGERARLWREHAARLRLRAGAGAQPYLGGVSESDRKRFTDDTDIVQPRFTLDTHEDTRTALDPTVRRGD